MTADFFNGNLKLIPTSLIGINFVGITLSSLTLDHKFMMFTSKTEYGLRAMVSLAKNKTGEPVSLSKISQEEHISQAYLERLFSKLKADGLIKSSKGAMGGYLLSRQPEKITMYEIIEALEGPLAVFSCMIDDEKKMICSVKNCLTKKVWSELQRNIIKTLRGFTLADLV